jgi:hypothetical protein
MWRFSRDEPGFAQHFTGRIAEDGNTIDGQGQLSRDDRSWDGDLALTYRRLS